MNSMKRLLAFVLIFCALLVAFSCAPTLPVASDSKILRWIEQVTLGFEYGGEGRVCSRWARRPTLSMHGGSEAQTAVVRRAVKRLNETLAKTPIGAIEIIAPEIYKSDIRVYFAPLSELPKLAEENGFPYTPGNLGYFWTFWNQNHEIQRAFVLLASDTAYQKYLPHLALEEITQTLGLSGDSPEFKDSIFYSSGDEHGEVDELSALDKKLIIFFYNHIQPGAREKDVQKA
ncbi:MAG: DUF2927 domain-containing protein, partial [Blastocatellia bacterium]